MWCSPPLAIDQADGSLFHLAKELVVELDMWSLCADGSLEYLLPDIYGDGAFPLVHSVKLAFGSFAATGNGTAFPPNAQANAKAFVQRILQMTPRVSEVEIDSGFYFDDLSSGDQFYLCDLLAQLFQFATRVRHFSSISGTIHSHQMSLVSHLVHLSYEVSRGGSINIVHLARQCAPTLQSLSMWLSRSDETVDLIRDGNGNYVQYPQLLLLEHGGNIDIEPDILPVFRGAIPFPHLKSLSFRSYYPFGDDTPFRGNAATLEKLSLGLNFMALEILRRHRLFTPTSHPVLRRVDLNISDFDGPEQVADPTDLLMFSQTIGPCAPMRRIDYLRSGGLEWIYMLPVLSTHQSIQVLELPRVCLTLHDSIVLIRSLPLLLDLHAMAPCLGVVLSDVDLGQLAAYFATKRLPAGLGSLLPYSFFSTVSGSWGGRFRFWCTLGMRPEKLVEAVHCVLLLALLCPSFSYYVPPRAMHQSFMDALEEAIDTDAFRPYATRLRCLLFTIW